MALGGAWASCGYRVSGQPRHGPVQPGMGGVQVAQHHKQLKDILSMSPQYVTLGSPKLDQVYVSRHLVASAEISMAF